MKFVMQHVAGAREEYVEAALKVIPDLQIVECWGVPMETFRESLVREAHWHLEDDIILPHDFLERCEKVVAEHGDTLIRGFSQKGKAGYEPGSKFGWTQIVWFPEGWGTECSEFCKDWKEVLEQDPKKWGPTGYDYVIRDWLQESKRRYWMEVPSLVQHVEGSSMLGPRSRNRQSQSFIETYGDLRI